MALGGIPSVYVPPVTGHGPLPAVSKALHLPSLPENNVCRKGFPPPSLINYFLSVAYSGCVPKEELGFLPPEQQVPTASTVQTPRWVV